MVKIETISKAIKDVYLNMDKEGHLKINYTIRKLISKNVDITYPITLHIGIYFEGFSIGDKVKNNIKKQIRNEK